MLQQAKIVTGSRAIANNIGVPCARVKSPSTCSSDSLCRSLSEVTTGRFEIRKSFPNFHLRLRCFDSAFVITRFSFASFLQICKRPTGDLCSQNFRAISSVWRIVTSSGYQNDERKDYYPGRIGCAFSRTARCRETNRDHQWLL